MKRQLEAAAPEPEQADRNPDGVQRLGDPLSPYLTAEEVARYLRFPTVRAFYKWLEKNPIPTCKRGRRVLLFERRAIDAYVRGELGTKRRAS